MLRNSLLLAARRTPVRQALRRMLPQDVTVGLYFHHVDPGRFRSWFAQMQSVFEFISYDDAIKNIQLGRHEGRRAFISFDDGFASTLDAGLFLAERGVSAAHFVCSKIVGEGDQPVAEYFGYHQPESVLDWDDLEALAASGQRIASHTASHVNLGAASQGQITDELVESRRAIAERFGACDHLAWPFGRPQNVSPAVFEIGRKVGYQSVASAIRGVHTGSTPALVPFRHVVAPLEDPNETLMFVALSARDLDRQHRLARRAVEQMAERGLEAQPA